MATKLDYDDMNMLAERTQSLGDWTDLLEAWGFDVEGFEKFMLQLSAIMAEKTAGIDAVSACGVAWFGGFELGYLARIEVESRELLTVPEALPE